MQYAANGEDTEEIIRDDYKKKPGDRSRNLGFPYHGEVRLERTDKSWHVVKLLTRRTLYAPSPKDDQVYTG